jgi:AcrR family transcriptional regulator
LSTERLSTKDRLLDAAQNLFAERGFAEVSVRELASVADVNVAAINYHFHGKENLIREVIVRRFILQRDRILSALDRLLSAADQPPRVEEVIRVLVRQHLGGALAAPGMARFLTLMSRDFHDPATKSADPFFKLLVVPTFTAFSRALLAARPALDQDKINWILASIIGQVHHFIMRRLKQRSLPADSESLAFMLKAFPALGLPTDQYVEQVTEHITRFSTAAIDGLYPEVSR